MNLHGTPYEGRQDYVNTLLNKYDLKFACFLYDTYAPKYLPRFKITDFEDVEIKIYKDPETLIEEIKNKIHTDNLTLNNYLGKFSATHVYSEDHDIYSEYTVKLMMNYSYFTRIVNLVNSYDTRMDFHDIVLNDLTDRFLDHHLEVLDSELAMTIIKWHFGKTHSDGLWFRNIFKFMKLAQRFEVTKERFCEHFLVPDFFKNFIRFYYFTRSIDYKEPSSYNLYSETQLGKVKIKIFGRDFKRIIPLAI